MCFGVHFSAYYFLKQKSGKNSAKPHQVDIFRWKIHSLAECAPVDVILISKDNKVQTLIISSTHSVRKGFGIDHSYFFISIFCFWNMLIWACWGLPEDLIALLFFHHIFCGSDEWNINEFFQTRNEMRSHWMSIWRSVMNITIRNREGKKICYFFEVFDTLATKIFNFHLLTKHRKFRFHLKS